MARVSVSGSISGSHCNHSHSHSHSRYFSAIPSFANVDPKRLGIEVTPHHVSNLVNGSWQPKSSTQSILSIPNPIDKHSFPIFTVANVTLSTNNNNDNNNDNENNDDELKPFIESMKQCPKSGQHNPFKNVDRYLMYGDISRRAGGMLSSPNIQEFFVDMIVRCVPKSRAQALGEVEVTAAFLNNFGGDNVRWLAKSFGSPGDHLGQQANGYRYVCVCVPVL